MHDYCSSWQSVSYPSSVLRVSFRVFGANRRTKNGAKLFLVRIFVGDVLYCTYVHFLVIRTRTHVLLA